MHAARGCMLAKVCVLALLCTHAAQHTCTIRAHVHLSAKLPAPVHSSVCVRFAPVCARCVCSQGVPGMERAWALSCVCVCTHVPHSVRAAGVCTGMGSPADAHMEGVRAQGVCCRSVGARGTQWGAHAQGCVAVLHIGAGATQNPGQARSSPKTVMFLLPSPGKHHQGWGNELGY